MQDEVKVREIETVAGDFLTEAGVPFYRVEIDGFCADFDYREAAENFANAINQMVARHRHQAERDTLARMEWRDIESAPAATGKEQGNLRVLVIGGIFEEATIVLADGEWWRMRAKVGAKSVPTYWMPLPPAPEAGQ